MKDMSQRLRLERAITFKEYLGIGLGTIIGIGWVMVVGDWLERGGPLGAMLGFLGGGLILITIGMSYAELTPAIPVAGGEVAFAYRAFGTSASFLTAWFLTFAYIMVCPFEVVALGWLLEYIFPGIKSRPLYSIGGYSVSLSFIIPGVIIGLFILILNYRGVRSSARFQAISTSIIVICAMFFTLVAVLKGKASHMMPLFSRNDSFFARLESIIAVLGIVPFFMTGFDTIPQAAEESGRRVNPKDLGKAIIISILVGALFYVIVIFDLALVMPWKESISFEMPTAEVFRVAFGFEWVARLVLVAAFFGLVTSLNGTFLASSRVIFSAGRGGLLPKWFGAIHPKFKTPKNAILFAGVITLSGPFIGKSSLLPIVSVASLAAMCAWFITCLASIRLRKIAPKMKRPYRVKHKIVFYLGASISAILIFLILLPGSSAQLKWPTEYFVLSAWMVLGILAHLWRKRKGDISAEERDYQILGDHRE